ncbi:Aste57867_13223 [Aphanomyces stellatus]|uniref:Aste57867_13223 protein n=1 Tax=Aphanomyces stellatus TaxID=120398 RepID=A0A485KXK6_9STRA|nr:hypothetical protein As57867_013174 [Aphanomyces stellatus]VFT90063.1 Aste57867_13223 [Aphanomyces stellatus]
MMDPDNGVQSHPRVAAIFSPSKPNDQEICKMMMLRTLAPQRWTGLRHFAKAASKTPKPVPLNDRALKRCDDFVTVAKVMRTLQAARSDMTDLPLDFVVPAEAPWPEQLYGKTIRTSEIRRFYKDGALPASVVDDLNSVHFIWDKFGYLWNNKIAALRVYKELYGHTRVPFAFVVPDEDPAWPKDTWNLRLGRAVSTILKDVQTSKRKQKQLETKPDARQQQLLEIDFDFTWDQPYDLSA